MTEEPYVTGMILPIISFYDPRSTAHQAHLYGPHESQQKFLQILL